MGARKLSELIRKHSCTPRKPINSPATAGPTTAAPLNTEELSAIAFMRSSRPTISIEKAWRAGTSKTLMRPTMKAAARTIGYCASPKWVSRKSAPEGTMNAVWVMSKIRRL